MTGTRPHWVTWPETRAVRQGGLQVPEPSVPRSTAARRGAPAAARDSQSPLVPAFPTPPPRPPAGPLAVRGRDTMMSPQSCPCSANPGHLASLLSRLWGSVSVSACQGDPVITDEVTLLCLEQRVTLPALVTSSTRRVPWPLLLGPLQLLCRRPPAPQTPPRPPVPALASGGPEGSCSSSRGPRVLSLRGPFLPQGSPRSPRLPVTAGAGGALAPALQNHSPRPERAGMLGPVTAASGRRRPSQPGGGTHPRAPGGPRAGLSPSSSSSGGFLSPRAQDQHSPQLPVPSP